MSNSLRVYLALVRMRDAAASKLAAKLTSVRHDDRGSIGEWVMILVMAVGIVLVIWAVAQPLLAGLVRSALGRLNR